MAGSPSLDLTAMNAALKELYDGQVVEELVYTDNPFLAMVKKNTDFGGKYKPLPIITGASQGASATFATAQTNRSAPLIESFFLTRASDYSIGRVSNEVLLASKTDKMAFLEGAKLTIDMAIRTATNSLCAALFRNGTGSIGQIASITSGVIVLTDPNSVTQFEVNMVLQQSVTDGSAPVAALGYVIAVDRSAGTVTVSDTSINGTAATPTAWAATHFILRQGDSNLKIKGLAAWLPTTAPSATTFFAVDRSADTTRLGGVRYDGSAQSIEEALIDSSTLVAREGGHPNVAIVSYASYSALEKALGSRVRYVDLKGPAQIMFRGIEINGANGLIKVFPDRSMIGLRCFLLTMSVWELDSLGDAPMVLTYGDGLEMLRVADDDSAEVRVGYYAQLGCRAPGWNSTVLLGA